MPWRQEAKKDAVSGETPRGAASEHRSVGIRMGKPDRGEPLSSLPEKNRAGEARPGELKHLSNRRKRNQARFLK